MATIPRDSGSTSPRREINWRYFWQDNLTASWGLAFRVVLITVIALAYTFSQLSSNTTMAVVLLAAWLVGLGLVAGSELGFLQTTAGKWLKENLFNSISNAFLTLFLLMLIGTTAIGMYQWGVVNANFNPAQTAPEFRDPNGATWGVIWGARKLLLTGRLTPEGDSRALTMAWLLVGLGVLTAVVNYVRARLERDGSHRAQELAGNALMFLWLLTPFVAWILLFGIEKGDSFLSAQSLITGTAVLMALYGLLYFFKVVQFNTITFASWLLAWPVAYVIWRAIAWTERYPATNINDLGGYLLTLIIAISVILLSFPVGVMLALGRRSKVFGIPYWITWPIAIIATIYFFITSTLPALPDSRNTIETIVAFWPLVIPLMAWFFYRNFAGNVVAATSTAVIELTRGVPLITILFMAIVMAPFFLPPGTSEFPRLIAVIIGYTLFSSAYMAENIRGGLQAIPRGQFEAADALGFNNLQKMRFIIMPQALRIVIPAIVGQFIGTYKSSSLVSIVGLFDLLGITRTIVANDQWLGLRRELYIFLAVVYFVGSAIMSWYSRRLEKQLGVGER